MITLEYMRSFRLFGFTFFDTALSFLGVYLLAPFLSLLFLKFRLKISRKSWLLLTISLSILAHMLVGMNTPLVEDFVNLQNGFIVKVVVVLLTYLGIKEIKVLKK